MTISNQLNIHYYVFKPLEVWQIEPQNWAKLAVLDDLSASDPLSVFFYPPKKSWKFQQFENMKIET